LAVPLAEKIDGTLRDIRQDDGLFSRIIIDPHAQCAEAVGKLGLEIGAVFVDAIGGEGAGVDRADPAIFGDNQIREKVMRMVVRVAGDRCIDEIGSAIGTVLQSERRAGGGVDKSDPSNLARICAILSRMPLRAKPRSVAA